MKPAIRLRFASLGKHLGATAFWLLVGSLQAAQGASLSVTGTHVVPHRQSAEMRYRRAADFSLGARVEVFLKNTGEDTLELPSTLSVQLRGKTPKELLQADDWAWHDLPSAWGGDPLSLPAGALTLWSWNGKRAEWGIGTQTDLKIGLPNDSTSTTLSVSIAQPTAWISALTFLGDNENPQPDSMLFHIANETDDSLRVEACRLWLPTSNDTWRALLPQPWQTSTLEPFPADGIIPAQDRGGARLTTGPLPLTYSALEVRVTAPDGTRTTLWAHQRIKREVFDIGGGWVASRIESGNTLQALPYLRTLKRMHINSGMHQHVGGYSDTELYDQYPLKYMNRLQPLSEYDQEAVLPRVHAVEFLGEPQYGGGTPVPPQEVWQAFTPYAPSRLPTSVTHSEERVWRFYAGLSDFPHYDAYRVNAPAADSWRGYDRWDGERIRWGAPLETIGTMTRSLRELNRPRPIAYWAQGANRWGRYGGRSRRAPNPDELRAQAYHGLAGRITSLYWFNLSLKSLVQYRDLIAPITQVNRETLLLADLLLEGDAYEHRRESEQGKPTWDLSSVTGPRGGIFFVNDLAYKPNHDQREFQFTERSATFSFRLPHYLRQPAEVFRLDASGTHPVSHRTINGTLTLEDRIRVGGIYVASLKPGLQEQLHMHHAELIKTEQALDFDPAGTDPDFETLRQLLQPAP